MIVGIDGRSLVGPQAKRGVARYTGALTAALAAAHPDDDWRLLVAGGSGSGSVPTLDGVELVRRRSRQGRHLAGALTGRPRLDRALGGVNVVWAPAPAPLAISRGVPLVLTLHDLSFVERPGDFTPYERLWHRLARVDRLARRADRVLADTRATADAAIARWQLDPARVTVVYPGVDRPGEVRPRSGRYLLFVGALEPRKAPDVLAGAYRRARERGLDVELVVVGTGRMADVLDLPGVRRLDPVADLQPLYAGALALVMPSHHEGFGLPPLEAAAHGTPAVVSDLPPFRETLGDAALRVPPGDEEALADALLRIAGDDRLRERLSTAARAAVAELTWERAAAQVHAALREAARS
jgi:glycosyltransferase involved in cell wall biosynthesis